MVEINAAKQNIEKKKKERKEMKTAQETTGATLNAPIIHYTL